MICHKYPLSELQPIKTVFENELPLAGIEHSVREFGFCAPLVITPGKKIVDGNSRWHVLTRIYGPKWFVPTISCDIPENRIWQAHMLINNPAVIPAYPVENLLKTVSETMKWRLLSKLPLSVVMELKETAKSQ